jgi:predicted metal-dependent peptidase
MDANTKLATARRIVRLKLPYFTRMLLSLAPVEVPGLGTFGVTEHLVLVYDPAKLEEWDLWKVAFVLAHEVMHVYHRHCDRAKRMLIPPGMTHPLAICWNVAGDAYINAILKAVFRQVPDDAVLPDKLPPPWGDDPDTGTPGLGTKLPDNATTEEAFAILKNALPQQPQGSGGEGKGEDGEGEGGAGSGGEGDEDGQSKAPACGGHCGSGAGRELPGEPGLTHEASRSSGEVRAAVKATSRAIVAHAEKSRGSVPLGLLESAIREIEPPKVRWETMLARAVRDGCEMVEGQADFEYGHGMSHLQASLGFARAAILPVAVAPRIKVAFVLDTSGSMSTGELTTGIEEVAGIIRAVDGDLVFMANDARVHELKAVDTWQEAAALVRGRGGTDFRPPFEILSKMKPDDRPNVVVFCTDAIGPAPEFAPTEYQTIWLITTEGERPWSGDNSGERIDWGTFVEVTR